MSLHRERRAAILIVEDDVFMARSLIDALELAGYRVWHASDGAEARHQLERARPDLILLDLILPDVDGLVLCYSLKAIAKVPIVICSATSRKRDPILALKLGADDFIHKPFELDDLLARLEVVLRSAPPGSIEVEPPPELRVGELLVEPPRHRVLVGNEPLTLTPTEFRLITVLAAHPDEVLTREEMAQQVWGFADAAHSRTIDVHVRRLRLKLTHAAASAPSIVSVRGTGYKLTAQASVTSAA